MANSHKIREFFSALKARITNLKVSPQLVALNSYLTKEELELAHFVAQQSGMQVALQSIHSGIAAELDARKKVFDVFFTLAAAAGVDDKRPTAAVAAASSIVLVELGKWIDSLLKKFEKREEIWINSFFSFSFRKAGKNDVVLV